uniref:Uncharacterized protein n=1 Tax=Trichuris muris TaxID=70415 RepID=A0A5S6R4A1_TRIMR
MENIELAAEGYGPSEDNEGKSNSSDAVTKKLKKADDYLEKCARYKDFIMKTLAENSRMLETPDASRMRSEKRNGVDTEQTSEYHIPYFMGKLRCYQVEGVKWLKNHDLAGLNGILADDMGLGKTVQCIAFLCDLIREDVVGPFCIVVPCATLDNWENEFKRFAPKIPINVYRGSKEERKKLVPLWTQIHYLGSKKCYPIVISNYELVKVDKALFKRIEWRFLILDEGHRIKNCKSVTRNLMKELRSSGRLLLTGTPVQNNIEELWSLLNFVVPELFFDKEWFQEYFDFGSVMRSSDTSAVEACKQIVERIHDILDPFILRRMKSDVEQQLPRKKDFVVRTPLSKLQVQLLKEVKALQEERSHGQQKKNAYSPEKKFRRLSRSSGNDSIANSKNSMIKKFLSCGRLCPMTFRHIANHPYLLNEIECERATGSNLINSSGKLIVMDKLLTSMLKEDGHKVLIFSQFVEMIYILERYCEYRSFQYRCYHGQMPASFRAVALREFNDDPEIVILLLSTRAGGLGLNLMAADTVIMFDSDWNPQCDNQAMDRCYRIGQEKPVNTYRLVARGTIDEIMLERASGKQRLEVAVVEAGKFNGRLQKRSNTLDTNELIRLLAGTDFDRFVVSCKGGISDAELKHLLSRG